MLKGKGALQSRFVSGEMKQGTPLKTRPLNALSLIFLLILEKQII